MDNLEDKTTEDKTARKSGTGIYLLICVAVAILVYLLLPNKPNPWRGPMTICGSSPSAR